MSPNAILNAIARPIAERLSAEWKGTSLTGGKTKNFINGEFVDSKTDKWFDVHDPVSSLSWATANLTRPTRIFDSQHRLCFRRFLRRRVRSSNRLLKPLHELSRLGAGLVSLPVNDL